MKVLMVNGSAHEKGSTYTALTMMAEVFAEEGIESEIFWIGNKPIGGCIGCGGCGKTGKCIFGGVVTEFAEKAKEADGFIFGSPVHYAAASGNLTAFLDRVFYSSGASFQLKPAASVVVARRGGCTAAFDQLNKYATITQMPIVSSCYWNQIHGATAADIPQDKEGVRILRTLARNMSWMLRCIQAGKDAGVALPQEEPPARTNFVR